MTKFDLARCTCLRCRAELTPGGRSCASCGATVFSVVIERSASGFDLSAPSGIGGGTMEAFLDEATDDAGGSFFYRTHSLLRCREVSGNELAAFLDAPIEERRRMYVEWKRRELRATLDDAHALCDRCGVAFKRYENDWNRAGLCSRTCHEIHLKSQPR